MTDPQQKIDEAAAGATNQKSNLLARLQAPVSINALVSVHPEICLLPAGQREAAALRVLKMAYTACVKNPELMKCAPDSIVAAVVEAAQLGLPVDGVLGHAYLVPYWSSKRRVTLAQFQVGYRGLLALHHRSDKVERVAADVICEGDQFEYSEGTSPVLHHKPPIGYVTNGEGERVPVERGEVLGAYALAVLRGAREPTFRVLSIAEIYKHRNISKGWQAYEQKKVFSNPWADHFEAMAMKTALRMLSKLLPTESAQRVEAQETARDLGLSEPPATLDETVIDADLDGAHD